MYYSLSADKSVKYRLDRARKGTQYSWTFSWNSHCRNNLSSHGLSGLFSVMSPLFSPLHVRFFLFSLFSSCVPYFNLSFPADFKLSYPRNSNEDRKKKKTFLGFYLSEFYFFPRVIVFFWWPRWFEPHEATYFLISTFYFQKENQ